MFQRILVPVDGSSSSFLALDQALQIAAREDSIITTLCVIDARIMQEARVYLPMQDEVQVSSDYVSPQEARMVYQAWAEQLSAKTIDRGTTMGVKVRSDITTGIPHQEIIDRSSRYDLLIMGSWQTRWQNPGPFLAGQTVWQVIVHTRLPLLYVPIRPRALQTILVAYDDSHEAQDGLQLAATWAGAWGLTLIVLTVQPNGRQAQALLKEARHRAQPIVPRLIARDDKPTKAIFDIATQYDCGLIVLGARVHRSLLGRSLGRVTNRLLLAGQLPVLLSH